MSHPFTSTGPTGLTGLTLAGIGPLTRLRRRRKIAGLDFVFSLASNGLVLRHTLWLIELLVNGDAYGAADGFTSALSQLQLVYLKIKSYQGDGVNLREYLRESS
jgi:hypothetical protein